MAGLTKKRRVWKYCSKCKGKHYRGTKIYEKHQKYIASYPLRG